MKKVAPPRLIASAPVLLVKNVVHSAHYYRDAMGFIFPKFWGDPPSFVILRRDGMHLMLKQTDDAAHVLCYWTVSKGLWNIYFWVSDADALHAEFVAKGAKIDYPVCDQPYGCREFGVQDIDGYDIGFGQEIGA
jgi:uncharacterized glyoxalase superfamily protein PhnB